MNLLRKMKRQNARAKDKKNGAAKLNADGKLVIYCSRCKMWFDTKNGWHADRFPTGIRSCQACGAPLLQIESKEFYKENEQRGRMDEVMTWEWPDGSFWKKDGGEAE